MARKILLILASLVLLVLLLGGALLGGAHLGIRQEVPPLPDAADVSSAHQGAADLPTRLTWVNTASQPMPRSAVLDPERDPEPDAPYVMSHPAFALEWADGRILLVDVGMTREGALEFGAPVESFGGGGPIEPGTPVREALGPSLDRVEGVLFTHLHQDHVGAIGELCRGRSASLGAFMIRAQAERPNYTTRGGLARIEESGCMERQILASAPLHAVPGFPGVSVIASAGHTPGSQIVAIRLASGGLFAITGDTVNHRDAVQHDLPKPAIYRWLVVPEFEERQRVVRGFLRQLHEEGFALLVNHDQLHLEKLGLLSMTR